MTDATTLMPEVHGAIEAAVRRRARRRAPRLHGLLVGRSGIAFACVAVLAGGTAVAATVGGWHPVLGSAGRGSPAVVNGPVPADQLAALAVLRRPQTAADRGRLVRAALRSLPALEFHGVYTDEIRVLAEDAREAVVLVPVERFGSGDRAQRDGLCLMSGSPGTGGWGGTCGSLDRLRSTGIEVGAFSSAGGVMTSAEQGRTATSRRIVLVPDGVARVKVRLRGDRWVTATVHDNVYSYALTGFPAYLGTIWYDAAGRRIARPRPPRPG